MSPSRICVTLVVIVVSAFSSTASAQPTRVFEQGVKVNDQEFSLSWRDVSDHSFKPAYLVYSGQGIRDMLKDIEKPKPRKFVINMLPTPWISLQGLLEPLSTLHRDR